MTKLKVVLFTSLTLLISHQSLFAHYINEVISFSQSETKLLLQLPEIECPEIFNEKKSCFHSSFNKKKLILDPGHSLFLYSLRNFFHTEVHEGQSNMVEALLIRNILKRCAPYNIITKEGFDISQIHLTHYPGEYGYGDYESGMVLQSLKEKNRAEKESGKVWGLLSRKEREFYLTKNPIYASASGPHLRNRIDYLLGKYNKDSVVISIHADAPDKFSVDDRKKEYPYVIFPKWRPKSFPLAVEISFALEKYTTDFYEVSQQGRFLSEIDEVQRFVKIPGLTIAGWKGAQRPILNNFGGYRYQTNASYRSFSNVLTAGESDIYPGKNYVELREIDINPGKDVYSTKRETELLLIEAFFMDGAVVGAKMERELNDYKMNKDMSYVFDRNGKKVKKEERDLSDVITAQFQSNDRMEPREVNFYKTQMIGNQEVIQRIRMGDRETFLSPEGSPWRQDSNHVRNGAMTRGEKLRGLKVSKIHKAVAKAIAEGLLRRFQCDY